MKKEEAVHKTRSPLTEETWTLKMLNMTGLLDSLNLYTRAGIIAQTCPTLVAVSGEPSFSSHTQVETEDNCFKGDNLNKIEAILNHPKVGEDAVEVLFNHWKRHSNTTYTLGAGRENVPEFFLRHKKFPHEQFEWVVNTATDQDLNVLMELDQAALLFETLLHSLITNFSRSRLLFVLRNNFLKPSHYNLLLTVASRHSLVDEFSIVARLSENIDGETIPEDIFNSYMYYTCKLWERQNEDGAKLATESFYPALVTALYKYVNKAAPELEPELFPTEMLVGLVEEPENYREWNLDATLPLLANRKRLEGSRIKRAIDLLRHGRDE